MKMLKCLLAALPMGLAGCAGLQVDVDVYKGPLANSGTTQRQQVASMVLSAKPLIVEYRNHVMRKVGVSPLPGSKTLPQDFITDTDWNRFVATDVVSGPRAMRHASHLNSILSFYKDLCVDRAALFTSCISAQEFAGFDEGRQREGLETLAKHVVDARFNARVPGTPAQDPRAAPLQARDTAPSNLKFDASDLLRRSTSQAREEEEQRRRREDLLLERSEQLLQRALVDFSARVQFYTNNQWLLDDGKSDEMGERLKTLLETVSNTILVQADELRRETAHVERLERLSGSERWAARQVLRPTVEVVFDQLQRRIESELQPRMVRAKAQAAPELDAAQAQSLQAGLAARRHAVWFAHGAAVVLGTGPQDAAVKKSIQAIKDHGWDFSAELLQWQDSLRKSLPSTGTTTVAALKAAIDKWAQVRVEADADLDAALRKMKPDHVLLTGMRAEIAALALAEPGKPPGRQEALTLLRKVAIQRAEEAVAAFRKMDAFASEFKAPASPERDGRLTSEQFTALQAAFRGMREEVVKASLKRTDVAHPLAVKMELTTALGRPGAEFQAALAVLKPMPAPSIGADIPQEASNSRDVLDAYIAELRYDYLRTVREKGDEHAEARNLAAALVQARKQRADMVFVRPSSAYLRSALAASFAQENPHVRWSNMLNDTLQNIGRNFAGLDADLVKTRADLDKVFWQNINRVRLNAGGWTNYVLAKDDVGNWYVKGMGADPTAMINAAKNMALFNLGTRMNTNLLRMDELRGRIDNDRSASEAQLKGWNDELKSLQGGTESAGAVGERNSALGIFRANYAQATQAHLGDLSAALAGYKQQIVDRWTLTVGESTLPALTATMARPSVDKHLTDAQTALQNLPKERAPADAIIEALQGLERYRVALRSAVAADTALVQAAQAKSENAGRELVAADEKVVKAFKDVESSASDVTTAAAKLKKGRDEQLETEKLDILRTDADTAVTAHEIKMEAYQAETKAQSLAREKVAAGSAELKAALMQRQRAAEDVDAVLKRSIGEWVAKRMRAVEELETAASVVGRRSQ